MELFAAREPVKPPRQEVASWCFGRAFFQQAATLHEQKLFRRDRAVLCLQRAVRAMPDRATFKRARQLLYCFDE